jgi:cytidylate kinase
VEREYAVALARPLTGEQAAGLSRGVELEDGMATVRAVRPATRRETDRLAPWLTPAPGPALAWYRVVLAEGRKRQVRRMFAAVGARVERLVRVRFGPIALEGLAPGTVRSLTPAEVARLRGVAGGRGRRGLIVALDGPGSSGKSSVGAAAAAAVGYRFGDTGLLYRAVTWLALARDVSREDALGLAALVDAVQLEPDEQGRLSRVVVGGRDVSAEIASARIDRVVSVVAREAEVRRALLERQRALAAAGGIVLAGRDIGTVVLPDADLKLYLDASVEERARRRAEQRGVATDSPEGARILADLRRRDRLDATRPVAPLRPAPDAVIIHTDGNTLEQTVAAVVAAIREREGGAAA